MTPLVSMGPTSGTLFNRLAPEQTGVIHRNTLSPQHTVEYLTMGAGVAAGDYDGDGLVDIYLVSQEGPNKLYRNLGNWRFEDVTESANADVPKLVAAGRWRQRFTGGAHFADVDNDGDLDLLVTALAGAATLLGNNGDGTFTDVTEAAGVGHIGASTTVTFGDYDRDGHLDLYMATHRPYRSTKFYPAGTAPEPEPELQYDISPDGALLAEADRLYRNRGDGTFEDVSAAAGIEGFDHGLGAKFSDLNGDGWPDIYVANDFESVDRLYINQRDGTFREAAAHALRHVPLFSMGMDTGDVNGDGRLDIITSDMLSPNRVRRQTQAIESMIPTGQVGPTSDGLAQIMRNSLHIANGDGTFNEVAWYAGTTASDWTWTMKFADFDLDGFIDVVVTNGFLHDDMSGDENLAMTKLKQAGLTAELHAYERARPPLLTPNVMYRNNGDLTFDSVAAAWGFDEPSISNGLALADFDNDGDLDMVVNDMNAPAAVYRNDASANRIKVGLRGTSSNIFGLGARMTLHTTNGIQVQEMSTSGGFLSGHEAVAVFGLGTLPGAERLTIDWPSGHTSEVTDLPANSSVIVAEPAGPAQIVEPTAQPAPQFRDAAAAHGVAHRHVESPFDDFAVQPLLPERMSRYGPGLAWGDPDGSGTPSLAIGAGAGQSSAAYRGGPADGFTPLSGAVAPSGYEHQAMLWWPGGTLLASLSSVETDQPGPHPALHAVSGSLDVSAVSLPGSAGPLAAADFDNDGRLDLFVGGRVEGGKWPEPTSSGLFRGVGTALQDVTDEVAPALRGIGMVTGAAWTDVDGDGDPDLVLARDMGSLALLVNEGGRLQDATERSGFGALTGRWTGLATGDVDGDGDIDIVAGNLGLNTRYTASADAPYVVLAGDVAGDGGTDVIEIEWEGGRMYPMRSPVELGRQIPYFGSRFPSFAAFARATVDAVFGAERLAATTRRYDAVTLGSTLFLNDGSGVFTAHPLPPAAQLLAAYGVVLEDLDGDSHLDIYIVGNHYGPEPIHIGRHDGGVSAWLRGDGTGAFTEVPVAASGLSVPFEAKGLAVADYDLDGWADLAVGVTDGAAMLFHNAGVPGHSGLVVRLRGDEGNPNGVGAKVTLRLADGTTRSREVQAGSSFLSQNSTDLVFGLGPGSSAGAELTVQWPDGEVSEAAVGLGPLVEIAREP